ncbi:MAG TPA: extracellular solute-binding protein [Actinopolymorphaceae bacterium]|jgi:ABC-type glycerol-3-phosphate transport system substrate-binding protein
MMTSRRSVLKAMAASGVLALGGSALASCSSDGERGSGETVDVTLTTYDGWPFGPMPTAKEQKDDPTAKAYAGVLREWMREHPGVKIKNATLNVWDQQALTTAITGGTAPSLYPGDVIGGWNRANVRSAMLQGLVADMTEYLEQYKVHDKLEDYAKPIWEKWEVNGRFYASPWIYNVGTGLHYRRDLVQELGLKEPTPDWTWDDVRELAKGLTEGKRKGIVLQGWGLNMGLNADGMDFHSTIPAPETGWNWRWDYSSRADQWIPLIERMRAMIFEDQSVLADISMGDGDTLAAFFRGDAAIHNNTVIYFTIPPGSDNAPADLAARLDKPIEEVVGWMTQPNGTNGRTANTQGQVDLVGFSPDLDDDALDAAMSLLLHVQQRGWVEQRKAVYEATNDPKHVYDWANIMPLFKGLLDQVPSSPEEAWGTKFMNEVRRAAQIPIAPNEAFYFPAEPNPAPSSTIRDDMTSRWTNERGNLDLRADLKKLDDTRNQQAQNFTSGISDEDFIEAASGYYEAHAAYWQENAPDYYQNVYQPWYEQNVLPALSG